MRRPLRILTPAVALLLSGCVGSPVPGTSTQAGPSTPSGSTTASRATPRTPRTTHSPPAPSSSPQATTGPAGATVIALSGTEAYGLAATDDSVWATLYGSGVLSRIDPSTSSEADAIEAGPGAASLMPVGNEVWMVRDGGDSSITVFRGGDPVADVDAGEVCCDLTSLGRTVWAVDPGGALVGIDAATHRVVDRFPVPLHRNVHVNAVGAGDSLWVSSDDTALMRVDPDSGVIAQRIATGGGVPFVEHDGLLWGAKPDQLWAVDTGSGRIVRRISLQDSEEVLSMAVDDRSMWLGMRHIGRVGAVERLALASGRVLADLPVDIPARIVLAFGSAWVTDSGSGDLYRFEPGAGSDS